MTIRMQSILQFYRNRRARRLAAQTIAEMDAAALGDIGMGGALPWILIDMGPNSCALARN